MFKQLDYYIGDELKTCRISQGLSLQDVAYRLKCDKTKIYYWEKGKVSISVPNLERLCAIYNIDMYAMLNRVKDKWAKDIDNRYIL